MTLIEVDSLTKAYTTRNKESGFWGAAKGLVRAQRTRVVAVDAISFRVERGQIMGYIGVNGSGKSTTIKLLTGILAPTSGQVRVLGRDPYRQRGANARDIGVVFGQRTQLWWDLPLIESLNLIARIYGTPRLRHRHLLELLTDRFDLGELLRKPIRTMSLGQKMRAELAATLIHEPKVVYLDEPTIGLDIMVKDQFRALIKEFNQEYGTTVVMTSHDIGDIEELCQQIVIIDAGKLVYNGSLKEVKERFGAFRTITFEVSDGAAAVTAPPGATVVRRDGATLGLRFDRRRTSASQVVGTVMSQAEVRDFTLSEPSLESIVKQMHAGEPGAAVLELVAEVHG
jgi:ABC-2 type transport system ATP-binding protein